jgi:hypothetical protein
MTKKLKTATNHLRAEIFCLVCRSIDNETTKRANHELVKALEYAVKILEATRTRRNNDPQRNESD